MLLNQGAYVTNCELSLKMLILIARWCAGMPRIVRANLPLPKGHVIRECSIEAGSLCHCGCYTVVKAAASTRNFYPICKIHGGNADQGAKQYLQRIRDHGYTGIVITQFPIYGEGSKNVTRKQKGKKNSGGGVKRRQAGQYQKKVLRVDMLLCGMSTPALAAVEIQGAGHGAKQQKDRDKSKAAIVEKLPGVSVFELAVSDLTGNMSGGGHAASGQSCSVRPQRCTQIPSKYQDMVLHGDSRIMELVKYLK